MEVIRLYFYWEGMTLPDYFILSLSLSLSLSIYSFNSLTFDV